MVLYKGTRNRKKTLLGTIDNYANSPFFQLINKRWKYICNLQKAMHRNSQVQHIVPLSYITIYQRWTYVMSKDTKIQGQTCRMHILKIGVHIQQCQDLWFCKWLLQLATTSWVNNNALSMKEKGNVLLDLNMHNNEIIFTKRESEPQSYFCKKKTLNL